MEKPPTANLFETALREGAGLTFSAMLASGLASMHDPLPTDRDGMGLAALALDCQSGAQELCAALLLLKVDAKAPHALPRSANVRQFAEAIGETSPPLASQAIASNREDFSALWELLQPRDLLAIASTALPLAAMANNLDAAKALFLAGADPNLADKSGMHACSRCKSRAMLVLFAERGANLRSPIHVQKSTSPTSVLELVMGSSSNSAESKAMREYAAEWARTHMDAQAVPGDDLARSAFSALEHGLRDSARRCVEALGQDAASRRDESGFTMLARACEHGNFAEATRLLNFGADPFEPTPDGRSPWGILLSRRGLRGNSGYGERASHERASSLCDAIATKKKFKPVPWTKAYPGGHTLLGTLAGACEPHEFEAFAQRAEAAGFPQGQPISPHGLDAKLTILLSIILGANWCQSTKGFGRETNPRALAVCESIDIEKLTASTCEAFAEIYLSICSNAADGHSRPDIQILPYAPRGEYLRLPTNRFLTPGAPVDPPFKKAAAVIELGVLELGRLGRPLPVPAIDPHKRYHPVNSDELDRLVALYEKGALARASGPQSISSPASKRL